MLNDTLGEHTHQDKPKLDFTLQKVSMPNGKWSNSLTAVC